MLCTIVPLYHCLVLALCCTVVPCINRQFICTALPGGRGMGKEGVWVGFGGGLRGQGGGGWGWGALDLGQQIRQWGSHMPIIIAGGLCFASMRGMQCLGYPPL